MNKENFKILFAGGGTGGHLFSGIAVAEQMRLHYPQAQALFVGTSYGLEKEIVPAYGFPLQFIQATPLKGSGWIARFFSLLRLPKAYLQSKRILKKFQPDLVIGIGGYASGPMTLAAHFAKIPTAIIEQNSIPGFTNRQLARFVDKVFIAFEKARDFFASQKVVFSGNPTRHLEVKPLSKQDGEFRIFILGGSQGAHALNMAMIEALPHLKAMHEAISFTHQTGSADLQQVQAAYKKSGFSAEVFPFLKDLAPYYAKANLLLCRSGAGTIAELQNLGKPSILVPYPYAADDHQFYNAKEMEDGGAAKIILNGELNGEKLAKTLLHFQKNREELKKMEEKVKTMAKPQAAQEVLHHCLQIIK